MYIKGTYSDSDLVRPDFLIVGAMKSGTSTLWYHCRKHQSIGIPFHEVHFFDQEVNFRKGYKWYSDHLARSCTPETTLIGEKSPSYGSAKMVAARLKDYCPNVKLVWILRNPVDRSYSHYLHAKRKASEYHSFERALSLEPKRAGKKDHLCYLYRSQYSDHVSDYLNFFERNQMLFLKFEDMTINNRVLLSQLFQFLELQDSNFNYQEEHVNKTVLPRFSRGRYVLRHLFGKDSRIYDFTTRLCAINKKPGYPQMPETTRQKLLEYFFPFNKKLEQLVGFDISGWDH